MVAVLFEEDTHTTLFLIKLNLTKSGLPLAYMQYLHVSLAYV
jgi:hypothetical protein